MVVFLAAVASQTIRVHDRAGVGAQRLAVVERAVRREVMRDVVPRWGVRPVRFVARRSRGAWNLYVWRDAQVPFGSSFATSSGQHTYGGEPSQTPLMPSRGVRAYVVIAHGSWSRVLAHEVIEMSVDPRLSRMSGGWLTEVCDPVAAVPMRVAGVMVSDFVFRRWFDRGSSGPWDFMRATPGPRQVRYRVWG